MSQEHIVNMSETTLIDTMVKPYKVIDHQKRATDSSIKLAPDTTFTTHLLTHIRSPTSTWDTLSTLMLDPAYHEDGLCPVSDLIAALEATFEVFETAREQLTKAIEQAKGIRVHRTPKQLELMSKQYIRFMKPNVDEAKGEDETCLSKPELRRWIMEFMSAKDGVVEDLGKWKVAYGGV